MQINHLGTRIVPPIEYRNIRGRAHDLPDKGFEGGVWPSAVGKTIDGRWTADYDDQGPAARNRRRAHL
jgi:hypothetical protein